MMDDIKVLEGYLDELAVDEQELLSILNNPKNEI